MSAGGSDVSPSTSARAPASPPPGGGEKRTPASAGLRLLARPPLKSATPHDRAERSPKTARASSGAMSSRRAKPPPGGRREPASSLPPPPRRQDHLRRRPACLPERIQRPSPP